MNSSKSSNTARSRRIFVDPSSISPHLHCKMCRLVFEQPMRLQCGHTFCYLCIQSFRICKCYQCKNTYKRVLQRDYIAYNLVDELIVRCIHQGCQWMGPICLSKKHQRNCTHRPRRQELALNESTKMIDLDKKSQTTNEKLYYEQTIPFTEIIDQTVTNIIPF